MEIGCPSLPQKLQGLPMDFLVLEEESLDLEGLPFLGLDCDLEGDYVDVLEGSSWPTKSLMGFSVYFFFTVDDCATNAMFFDPDRESSWESLACSLVNWS